VVRLEHIFKRYEAGAQVLSDVSLALEPGGFCFLTGASGSGKTTLLDIISLAEPPSRGRVVLFGGDAGPLDRAARAALRRRIGMVFQDLRLIEELSARDNVALPLRIAGVAEDRVSNNVAELLSWVGLAKSADAPAAALSGGERQRVAVARAIVARPQLLLADEPTGHGDEEVATLLVRAFEQMSRLGTAVLIATHDIAFAERFGHPRHHLDDGRVAIAEAEAASPGEP
jgi:cell division transport system ATP-binding protein